MATLHQGRGEIETALDELKTHLRGANIILRSKTPDLLRQEFYGLLLAHFAVRGFMHEAALKAEQDPDRLSFVHALRVVRRKMPNFLLTAKRDAIAATRFFRRALRNPGNSQPRVINVDKNPAYPVAVKELKKDITLKRRCKVRECK